MDFGCALGELDDVWALPEELTDVDSSYSPERLQDKKKAAAKLGEPQQDWSSIPFEFSIPNIPSPEYEFREVQPQQQHVEFDASALQAIEASIEASIDGSRYSNDTLDASVDESTEIGIHGYELGSPFMENIDDHMNLLSPDFQLLASAPGIPGSQIMDLGSMIQLPPQQQQLYLQGLALAPGQGQPVSSVLDMPDSNPQYVRTHPIPPQQQQNWRSFSRRQSISKMPLAQLYQIMGLPHNHSSAKDREERIMNELQKSGFKIGQQTWIRDTEEPFRRNVVDRIYQLTKEEYGYSKHLLEAIIRRGTYARMQSNLRRKRRHMSRIRRRGMMRNDSLR